LTLLKSGTYTDPVNDHPLSRAALLTIAAIAVSPAAPRAQAIQRSMYVSVWNDAGAPVPGLGPSDFTVREDNVAREVLRVTPAVDPMQLAVLVDNSQAASSEIPELRKALQEFVTTMTTASAFTGKNEITLIGLADRPTVLADWTSDRTTLLKGVDRIFSQPRSGTLLLQGLIEMSQTLKKREALRPVIVAIVTEGPELSDRYHDLVLGPLRDSGAAFHAIVVGSPRGGMGTNAQERGIVLDEGTRTTGGRRDNLLTAMALPHKMQEVADELTHQYRVTYARPQSLIPPEHVTVAAVRPGMTARGTLVKEPRQVRP
jgi:hypothetical protein